MLKKTSATVAMIVLFLATTAYAAHPLITDDAGTQGKEKFQLEVNGEYGSDREASLGIETTERVVEAATVLSSGVTDAIDAVIGVPYLRMETTESDLTAPSYDHANEKGLSDISVEIKWRFFEREGLSLAIKPGISVPTGSERKGLGAGKYGFSAYLIATRELGDWALHLNLGYLRNNNRADERENLNHVSLAGEYRLTEKLRLVANVGQERDPDKAAEREPAFGLMGVIYGINGDFDLDAGFKAGIAGAETDKTVLAGMAWRF